MKITHVINSLATGGAERLVVELSHHGRRLGHDVEVVLLAELPGAPGRAAQAYGVPVKVLGSSRWDPRLIGRIRSATASSDIVHVHLFPALYLAARLPGPKVFTEHSTHNRRLGRRRYDRAERWSYDGYDRVIAISSGVASVLERHLHHIGSSTPVVRVPNGISDAFFNVERICPPDRLRLLCVGSLTPVKQHSLALEAMRWLPDATLDIAGSGPLRKQLESKIDELGLRDRVKLLGTVDDLPSVLKDRDILLMTSKYEGFSLVAAEAHATGMPVIGPNVTGLNEVVLNGVSGLLYQQPIAKEIANLILRAAEPGTYDRLSAGAQSNATRFDMATCFSANLDVYRSVLAAKR